VTGAEAVEKCEENADDGQKAGDSVEVDAIEVDGDTATAEVAISGGNFDGQTLAVSLAKEDDQWKLDSLDEFLVFDKEAFVAGITESIESEEATPAGLAECVSTELTAAADEEVQAAFLSGDQEQLFGLIGTCFGG
jgi:hypothetical protein